MGQGSTSLKYANKPKLQWKTCKTMLITKPANGYKGQKAKHIKKQINKHKITNIHSLVGMGHHALAHGSTSLGLGAMAQKGNGNEGEGVWVV